MKMKLVVTTQISLVNTVLKYKMQFAKFPALKSNALLHFMVQSGVHLKLLNISCTNTYTGPATQLRKKVLLSPSVPCMATLVTIAQQLAKQLSKRGVTDIKIYDVSKTNASYIIADA